MGLGSNMSSDIGSYCLEGYKEGFGSGARRGESFVAGALLGSWLVQVLW